MASDTLSSSRRRTESNLSEVAYGFHTLRVWWRHGGESVLITGNFNKWMEGVALHKEGDDYYYDLEFPIYAHKRYEPFKFIVDGRWTYDASQLFQTDDFGNINNYAVVPGHASEELKIMDEKTGDDSPMPAAPTSSSNLQSLFELELTSGSSSRMRRAISQGNLQVSGLIARERMLSPSLSTQRLSDLGDEGSMTSSTSNQSLAASERRTEADMSDAEVAACVAKFMPTDMSIESAFMRSEGQLVVVMVGLPARGKTFLARRLQRHLRWKGYNVEIFNVGVFRRAILGAHHRHDFFDAGNAEAVAARRQMAEAAMEAMLSEFASGLQIGIYDATNTTKERRAWIESTLKASGRNIHSLYLESICTDDSIIRANVRDTKGMDEETAVADFLRRIQHYADVYQTVDDEENISYVKIIDAGKKLIMSKCTGYLPPVIGNFVSHVHIAPRPIWLSRHGESLFNLEGKIGGDSALSPRGCRYALRLAAFMEKQYPPGTKLDVWTSTLKRTIMTAGPMCEARDIVQWRALDEIDAGVCDGMTYEEIEEKMPDEFAARKKDKYKYRYPRGESYNDVAVRLEVLAQNLLRQRNPTLIISHQATLRVVYAYLMDKKPEECPTLEIPLHTLIQITPKAYGSEEILHKLMD